MIHRERLSQETDAEAYMRLLDEYVDKNNSSYDIARLYYGPAPYKEYETRTMDSQEDERRRGVYRRGALLARQALAAARAA
jgi:hypothetical protein